MPYQWTLDPQHDRADLHLWAHRSLPKGGFAAFIGATFALILVPTIPLIGTPVLWGLLPFVMGAVWGIYAALQRSYRDGEVCEDLTLEGDRIEIVRHDPRAPDRTWNAHRHWVRTHLHRRGPVPCYLTLTGGGREVELGAFLTAEEREALHDDLQRRLIRLPA